MCNVFFVSKSNLFDVYLWFILRGDFTEFLRISVLRLASEPRVKLAGLKSALTSLPPGSLFY